MPRVTPQDFARQLARREVPAHLSETLAGNARVTITRAGKKSRTAAANTLRKFA